MVRFVALAVPLSLSLSLPCLSVGAAWSGDRQTRLRTRMAHAQVTRWGLHIVALSKQMPAFGMAWNKSMQRTTIASHSSSVSLPSFDHSSKPMLDQQCLEGEKNMPGPVATVNIVPAAKKIKIDCDVSANFDLARVEEDSDSDSDLEINYNSS